MYSNLPFVAPPASLVMAEQVERYPWHESSLGAIDSWSAAVRIAVNMVLVSSFPKCVCFGADLLMIYNDAFMPILGGKHPALGLPFKQVWSEAWEMIGPLADDALNGNSTFIEDFELDINRRGFQETGYFTFCYSPVYNETGAIIGLLDTVVETTEKVITERRLRDFAAALEREVGERTADRDRMWRMSVDSMIVVGADARIKAANPAFRRLLSWSEFDLDRRLLADVVHLEDRTRLNAELISVENTVFRLELRMLRKDGQYVAISWTGTHYEGSILAIGRDLTADHESQAALRQTEMALQQAQKMESIGRLTGGVAHDFNNLLQVISGNLQLLALDIGNNRLAEQRLGHALAGVERGAKLANHLLAFSRKQALEPKVVKIGRAITSMDDMLRRTLGEEIDIAIAIAPNLWNTFIDTAQVENALLNLCINARDAMEGHGKLTIEVANVLLDHHYAQTHHEVAAGQYVMLAVSDTGAGMPPEVIEKAFEPFFTTKPEGKGTGLGLSMVFGFVKQSGGHVKIYSEVGHGTTIKLYLPRSMDVEELNENEELRPAIGGTETILVVEDDHDVQTTVVALLKALGYRVIKANDASSGLAIIESGIAIDLLFTDVIMPGAIRSPELTQRAREILPQIAVLYTSGYTQNAIVHGGRLDKGVELLGKPYTREALARKIRHVLANQQQRNQSASHGTSVESVPSKLASAPRQAIRENILFVEDDRNIRELTVELLESLGHGVVAVDSAERALDLLTEDITILMTDMKLLGMSGEELALEARRRHPGLGIVFATGGAYEGSLDSITVMRKPYSIVDVADSLSKARETIDIQRKQQLT